MQIDTAVIEDKRAALLQQRDELVAVFEDIDKQRVDCLRQYEIVVGGIHTCEQLLGWPSTVMVE